MRREGLHRESRYSGDNSILHRKIGQEWIKGAMVGLPEFEMKVGRADARGAAVGDQIALFNPDVVFFYHPVEGGIIILREPDGVGKLLQFLVKAHQVRVDRKGTILMLQIDHLAVARRLNRYTMQDPIARCIDLIAPASPCFDIEGCVEMGGSGFSKR